MIKHCSKHGYIEYRKDSSTKNARYRCPKCSSEAVSKRRKKTKELLIEQHGGKCCLCGYDTCVWALVFHHINPEEKEFAIGSRGLTRSIEKLKVEANKCILVCSNCHYEIHAGLRVISSPNQE